MENPVSFELHFLIIARDPNYKAQIVRVHMIFPLAPGAKFVSQFHAPLAARDAIRH